MSYEEELKILFHSLCDGLRQEVRFRRLAQLATGQDFSLKNEREQGFASSLAVHLRSVGFLVQLESYYSDDDSLKLRPDFCVWLPASKKYIYLEFKMIGWGDKWPYSFKSVINNIEKLDNTPENKTDLGKGMLAIGFSRENEEQEGRLWQGFDRLSQKIDENYPKYKLVEKTSIDLQEMDENSSYAVVGLWFRKY